MSEKWVSVHDWPFYEVSSKGRVRSTDKVVRANAHGGTRTIKGKIRTLQLNPRNGYVYCSLRDSGRSKNLRVHRLVLEAFVGPCPDGMEALHIDGNKLDNSVENLRWGTHSENMLDKVAHGKDHNASKTHCINGHEYNEENTHYRKNGTRYCRLCNNERQSLRRRNNG